MSSIRSVNSALIALSLLASGLGKAQDTPLDPRSSVAINLPPDSPVTFMGADMGESRASARVAP